MEIVLTSVLTVIMGVLVFCISQIALKIYIEPIIEISQCRGLICDTLLFNRNRYLNEGIRSEEEAIKLEKEIRKLGSELLSIKNKLKWNKLFAFLKFSFKDKNIIEAHKSLIGLSNSIGRSNSKDETKMIRSYEKKIFESLNIKI